MRLALIASAPDTPQFSRFGDIELAFAHLCISEPAYGGYMRRASESGREVILDNGVMELDRSAAADALVEACWKVGPAMLTPPEILGDGPATLDMTREFIASERALPDGTAFLGVAHGKDFGEWLDSFVALCAMDEIGRVGIPYDIQFEVPGAERHQGESPWERMLSNRLRIVEYLDRRGLVRKPVHLLGCVDAIELRRQCRFPWIVSNDSSTVWVTTQQGLRYDPESGIRCDKKKIDMRSTMPEGRMELFLENLAVVRGYLAGVVP